MVWFYLDPFTGSFDVYLVPAMSLQVLWVVVALGTHRVVRDTGVE